MALNIQEQITPKLFGTSGIRGKLGENITLELALDVGMAVSTYIGGKGSKVVIGYDTRTSNEMIESAVVAGLLQGGCDVLRLNMYYEFTLKIHGGVPVYARWDIEENLLDVDSVLEAITPRTKFIFLCTPNNPTGGLIAKEDIERILEASEAIVVVDEAYFEFSEVNNVDLLKDHSNLFILRTFSKVMARSSKSHIRNYNPLPWIYRCLSSSGMIYLKTITSIGFFSFLLFF